MQLEGGAPLVLFEAALRAGEPPANELFPKCKEVTISRFHFDKWIGVSLFNCDVPNAFDSRLSEMLGVWRASRGTGYYMTLILDRCTLESHTLSLFEEAFGIGQVRVVG